MCIAIYSPKGVALPCEEYLRNSWINNPDGGGFAFNTDDGMVQTQKGYMHLKELLAAIREADAKYDLKNRGVLIHARIATHGGVNPECCHPFPLVGDTELMKKLRFKSKYAVIHNGIIGLTSFETKKGVSDTMAFIDKYLSKIASNKGWFNNPTNMELVYDLADSKLAILDGKGDIISTPGFSKDEDGNYYSNASYSYDLSWYKSEKKKKNKKKSNGDKLESGVTYRALMKGEFQDYLMFDDDATYPISDLMGAGFDYYVDAQGNLYETERDETNCKTVKTPLYYLGHGGFCNVYLVKKAFVGKFYADANLIMENGKDDCPFDHPTDDDDYYLLP